MFNFLRPQLTQMSVWTAGSTGFVRTMMKTHKGAAKRWAALGSGGYKRGRTGRKHGNAGWSHRLLAGSTGTTTAKRSGHGNHVVRLKKLLPYS